MGETHLWSGPLYGGDQVILLLNAADEDLELTASLAEVFLDDGPGGSAPQVKQKWDVYDLWLNRMDDKIAQAILNGERMSWYNSSELSYKEGLEKDDERLLGKKILTINEGGSLIATVPRHGVKLFRLRAVGDGKKRYSVFRDEL